MKQKPYIGQLKYPITVETETKTRTTTGEETITGTTVIADVKAQLLNQQANDDVDGKLRSLIDRSYVLRYKKTITDNADNLIVRDQGVLYRVYNIIEVEKNRYLKLLVTKYE